MDNDTGDLGVIGTADVNKHENNLYYSRDSIALYQTVTAAGPNGPTMVFLAGKIQRQGFNSKFLMKYGADQGLGIIFRDKDYVKNKFWEDMTTNLK